MRNLISDEPPVPWGNQKELPLLCAQAQEAGLKGSVLSARRVLVLGPEGNQTLGIPSRICMSEMLGTLLRVLGSLVPTWPVLPQGPLINVLGRCFRDGGSPLD